MVEDPVSMSAEVVLARRASEDEAEWVTGFDERGVVVSALPINSLGPRFRVPWDALVALADQVKPGPGAREVARLEEALAVERARVDRLIDGGRAGQ